MGAVAGRSTCQPEFNATAAAAAAAAAAERSPHPAAPAGLEPMAGLAGRVPPAGAVCTPRRPQGTAAATHSAGACRSGGL